MGYFWKWNFVLFIFTAGTSSINEFSWEIKNVWSLHFRSVRFPDLFKQKRHLKKGIWAALKISRKDHVGYVYRNKSGTKIRIDWSCVTALVCWRWCRQYFEQCQTAHRRSTLSSGAEAPCCNSAPCSSMLPLLSHLESFFHSSSHVSLDLISKFRYMSLIGQAKS